MNKGMKRLLSLLMATVLAMASVTCVFAYSSSASDTDTTTEFGTLTGTSRILNTSGYEKLVCIDVRTTKKPTHFYLKYDIKYYTTGETIAAEELKDINVGASGLTSYEDVEMHHWLNKQTNKRDGFMNTKITSFSTHEARGNTSSYVYLATSL